MKKRNHPESTAKAGIILAALAACVSPGLLQTVGAQQAPVSTEPAGGLQEIIVTAQKRAQNSQDIGIALSAVTGEQLTALGAVTASDITKTMPAVVLTILAMRRPWSNPRSESRARELHPRRRARLKWVCRSKISKHYGLMGFDNTPINGLAQVYPGMPRWFKAHVNCRF